MRARWTALVRCFDDGRLALDNNPAERALRCVNPAISDSLKISGMVGLSTNRLQQQRATGDRLAVMVRIGRRSRCAAARPCGAMPSPRGANSWPARRNLFRRRLLPSAAPGSQSLDRMQDYCSDYPARLGGVILATSRDVAGSASRRSGAGASRAGPGPSWPMRPYGVPLDHPDLEPVWAEAAEHDLAVVLHTFTVMPPHAPGGLDNWENLFLQRSAAHPWCGMRNMAALIGSGVMDSYPHHSYRHTWRPATVGCHSG